MNNEVVWERVYYSNGQIRYEIPFVGNQYHGVAKWYYATGQLKCKTFYTDGLIHGTLEFWRDNGEPESIDYYIHGKQVSKEEYRRYELTCQLAGIKDE